MKKDWTEIMRDKLSESAVTPPEDMWTGISSELDAVTAPVKKTHKYNRIWRWAAVAAGLAALVICGINLYEVDKQDPDAPIAVLAVNSQGRGAASSQLKEDAAKVSKKPNNVLRNAPSVVGASRDDTVIASKDAYVPSEDASSTAENASKDAYVPSEDASKDDTVNASKDAYVPSDEDVLTTQAHESLPLESVPKSRRRMSVSLFASNTNMPNFEYGDYDASFGGIGNGILGSGDPPIYDLPTFGDSELNIPDNDDTGESDTPQSRLSDSYTVRDARHKQPVRFGLSARIPISDSFSIGTGVTYSLLSSNITYANSNNMMYNADQTLHYVGVPVSIDYNLPSYRSIRFYLTAGAMAEKCIYGESRVSNWPSKESIKEKGLQVSVFAGAGLQFNLNNHIALYAEPLATYYFDNHSDITNIYKDRPLNIDLRVGLRYTFR